MKREPSIHISESKLAELLKPWLKPRDSLYVAKEILIEAKKYQLSNRKLLANNQKLTQKANNIDKSPLEYTMIMAKAIYNTRKRLKHKGIDIAKPGSRDWTIIKDITASALEYCEELGLTGTYDTMFARYVTAYMGILGKTGKFNLLSFRGKAEQIIAYEGAKKELLDDKNYLKTERAYKRYNYHIIKQTGEILTHYDNMPEKYKFFMEVGKASIELGVTPEIWIDAQFAELEWTKSFPEPNQLVGDKAKERMQKYMYKNKIKIKDTPDEEENQDYKNKLKNLRKLK